METSTMRLLCMSIVLFLIVVSSSAFCTDDAQCPGSECIRDEDDVRGECLGCGDLCCDSDDDCDTLNGYTCDEEVPLLRSCVNRDNLMSQSCSSGRTYCLTTRPKYYVLLQNNSSKNLWLSALDVSDPSGSPTACASGMDDSVVEVGCNKLIGYSDNVDDIFIKDSSLSTSTDFTSAYGRRDYWFARHYFQACVVDNGLGGLYLSDC